MVGPQKRKPRALSSLAIVRLSGVSGGTSAMLTKRFWMASPFTKAQKKIRQRLALLKIEISARIGDGRFDLAAMPDNARIGKQLHELLLIVMRDFFWLEAVEGFAEALAFAKDGEPGQTGLETLQDQLLEELGVARFRNAPLFVVVANVKRVATCPGAAAQAIAVGFAQCVAPAAGSQSSEYVAQAGATSSTGIPPAVKIWPFASASLTRSTLASAMP